MDYISQLTSLGQILIAALLGGLIGYERETAGKPAGLRTHMLVAVSAATLVIIGHSLMEDYSSEVGTATIMGDPIRIIQAIIVGISFIGAGTIVQNKEKGEIQNLTTAATILFATTIGISVAVNQYVLAIALTIVNFLITRTLLQLEKKSKR